MYEQLYVLSIIKKCPVLTTYWNKKWSECKKLISDLHFNVDNTVFLIPLQITGFSSYRLFYLSYIAPPVLMEI